MTHPFMNFCMDVFQNDGFIPSPPADWAHLALTGLHMAWPTPQSYSKFRPGPIGSFTTTNTPSELPYLALIAHGNMIS